jgi:hypothetical protein
MSVVTYRLHPTRGHVKGAKRVIEACMQSCGINQMRKAQLTNSAQTLEVRSVNNLLLGFRHQDTATDRNVHGFLRFEIFWHVTPVPRGPHFRSEGHLGLSGVEFAHSHDITTVEGKSNLPALIISPFCS